MVLPIVKDPIFLARPSQPATEKDLGVAIDLLDTLLAHKADCVGMAANMIGVSTCIIAIRHQGDSLLMLNPKILKASKPYSTEEGCLSLEGTRKVKRFQSIKVEYQTQTFQTRIKTFTDWTAQIIQHELDHLQGILI